MPALVITVPRSKGPAWAGERDDDAIGGVLVGAREEGLDRVLPGLGQPQRHRAGAGGHRAVADQRGGRALAALRGRSFAKADAGELGEHPGRQGHLQARDVLLAGGPGDRGEELREGAGQRVGRAGLQAGSEGAGVAALVEGHRGLALHRRAPRPGGEDVVGVVGAALARGDERCAGAGAEVKLKARDRGLGQALGVFGAFEGARELTGNGVGVHLAGQLQVQAEFVGDQPDAEEIALDRGALVDGAGDRPREGRRFDLHRGDLGGVGAVGGLRRRDFKADFGGAAGGEAVAGAGGDRHALGQGDCGVAHVGGGEALFGLLGFGDDLVCLGHRQLGVEAGRFGSRVRGRAESQRRREGDLVAAFDFPQRHRFLSDWPA